MDRANLFIIGVNKAGTSWLYYLLNQHPEVFMSKVKEPYFFGEITNLSGTAKHDAGDLAAYHRHFPFEEDYTYFGEATAKYYQDAAVADDIQRYNPDAKLLAIVRDPIQRLLSQYRYRKQLGLLDEDTTVEEALDGRDPALIADSHYERTLPAFRERFGADQFKIVSLEAGRDHPDDTWQALLDYLNLPWVDCPDPDAKPENPTGSASFRRVYRLTAQPIKSLAPGVYEQMLQSPLARKIKLALIRLLGTAEPTQISPGLERRLQKEFAPTYAYLREEGFDVYDQPTAQPPE